MISFFNVNDEGATDRLADLLPNLNEEGSEELVMMLDSFRELSMEIDDVAVSAAAGCLLVRVCDEGEYAFLFPFELCEEGDSREALCELSMYVRRELLPFHITDVPRWGIDVLRETFPHIEARAYEEDDDTFAAIVLNELDLLEEYPTVEQGGVTLSPITDADAREYARLCSDRELNRYWGYDDLADNPTADPERFMLMLERERCDGVALSLAARRDGKYLAEAVIYNCDYLGTAEIGIRILPEYQGAGLGVKVLDALLEYCMEIGLCAVRARVMEENAPALKMTAKRMVETARENGVVSFYLLFTPFELELDDD